MALEAIEDDEEDVRQAIGRQLSPILAPGAIGLHHSVLLQLGWCWLVTRFSDADVLLDKVCSVRNDLKMLLVELLILTAFAHSCYSDWLALRSLCG